MPLEILAAVTLAVSVAVQPVAAQTRTSASVRGTSGISTPPRTPWGDPDLQGVWTNTTITPLERPESVAGKDVFMTRMQVPIYEYACHEGNYSIVNILKGAREQDKIDGENAKR